MPDETLYLWHDGSPNNPASPAERPRLEVHYPLNGAVIPQAVIILPGGGYEMLAAHEGEPFARFFAQRGLLALVCAYRVAPHRYPAPLADAARAVRLARHHAARWGLRPGGLTLLGFSAGGHLACTTATQPDLWHDPEDDLIGRYSARPDRLMLAYPVISMTREYHLGSAVALLGPRPPEALRRQLSNELYVTPANPPAFLFHTADDEAVPVSNSVRFAAACREQGVPAALHIYPSGPHGVGLAEEWPALRDWPEKMVEWLVEGAGETSGGVYTA